MTESSTPEPAARSESAPGGSVRTHQVRRHRGEGQWAKGHFTPLNPNEQVKKDDDGLNVRARIENVYSVRGFHFIMMSGRAVSRRRPDIGTSWTGPHRNWHARHMSRAGIALVVRRHVDYKRVSSAVCLPTR